MCRNSLSSISFHRVGRRQRGIALITAVLITALIAIIAVTMASEQQLDIRRTGNILDRAQAWQFALGMETIARLALRKDAENNKTDHRMEEWNKPVQFPAPDGAEGDMIGGRIEDLQGRFNLNNLVDGKGNIDARRSGWRTGSMPAAPPTGWMVPRMTNTPAWTLLTVQGTPIWSVPASCC